MEIIITPVLTSQLALRLTLHNAGARSARPAMVIVTLQEAGQDTLSVSIADTDHSKADAWNYIADWFHDPHGVRADLMVDAAENLLALAKIGHVRALESSRE